MGPLTTIFSLLVGAAGWYYMFYSRAATNLSGIEEQQVNDRRQRLRQIGGFVMLLLAVALFAGFNSVDSTTGPQAFVLIWLAVLVLLFTITILAMADLRLTIKLRNRRRAALHMPPHEKLP
jgi:4-amino-4-deoxy-L-arabinose transferase-like glycosyltransferase